MKINQFKSWWYLILNMVDKRKYKAVILFFANKIRNDTLGKVKLMKLLYFSDFDFFERYGKSITGDRYVRLPLGPVPEKAEDIIKEMELEGSIKTEKVKMPHPMSDKHLIVPIKPLTLEHFSKEELEMLELTAQKWEKFNGREMTDASHGEAPWIATKPSCIIDYNLVYYRNKYNEMNKM